MTAAFVAVVSSATVFVAQRDARARLRPPTRHMSVRLRPAVVALAVAAVAGMLASGVTVTVATSLAAAGLVLRRRSRAAAHFDGAELALALDVLAGCLSSGSSMPAALDAARVCAPARVADSFSTTAVALRRGDDPQPTWARLGVEVAELSGVARLCARSATTGAAVADELHRFAAAERTKLDTSRRRRLHRASVWVVLPLGLCFLPAFVLVGVVPMVLGAVSGVAQAR